MKKIVIYGCMLAALIISSTSLKASRAEVFSRSESPEPEPENPGDQNGDHETQAEINARRGQLQPSTPGTGGQRGGNIANQGGSSGPTVANATDITQSFQNVTAYTQALQTTVYHATMQPDARAVVDSTVNAFSKSLNATQEAFNTYVEDPSQQQNLAREVVQLRRSIKKMQALKAQGIDSKTLQMTIDSATEVMQQLQAYAGRAKVNEGSNTAQEPRPIDSLSEPVTPTLIGEQDAINRRLMTGALDGVAKTINNVQKMPTDSNKELLLDSMTNMTQYVLRLFPDSGASKTQRFSDNQTLDEFFSIYGTKIISYCKSQADVLQTYSPDDVLTYAGKIEPLVENMTKILNRMATFPDVQKENGADITVLKQAIENVPTRSKVVNDMQRDLKQLATTGEYSKLLLYFKTNPDIAQKYLDLIPSGADKTQLEIEFDMYKLDLLPGESSLVQHGMDARKGTLGNLWTSIKVLFGVSPEVNSFVKAYTERIETYQLQMKAAREYSNQPDVAAYVKGVGDMNRLLQEFTAIASDPTTPRSVRLSLNSAVSQLTAKAQLAAGDVGRLIDDNPVTLGTSLESALKSNNTSLLAYFKESGLGAKLVKRLKEASAEVAPFAFLYKPVGQGRPDIDLLSPTSVQKVLTQSGVAPHTLQTMNAQDFTDALNNGASRLIASGVSAAGTEAKALRELGTSIKQSEEVFTIFKNMVRNNYVMSAQDAATIKTLGQQYYDIANTLPRLDMEFSE